MRATVINSSIKENPNVDPVLIATAAPQFESCLTVQRLKSERGYVRSVFSVTFSSSERQNGSK